MRRRGCTSGPCCGTTCAQSAYFVFSDTDACCLCGEVGSSSIQIQFIFDHAINGTTTFSINWVSGNVWGPGTCQLDGLGNSFKIKLDTGLGGPTILHYVGNTTCTGTPVTSTIGLTSLVSYSCSSGTATWNITNANCSWLFSIGVRTLTLNWTSGSTLCLACTSSCTMPTDFFVTDGVAFTGDAATWVPAQSLWITAVKCSSSVSPSSDCVSQAAVCHSGTQSKGAGYWYTIGCVSDGHMEIRRYWNEKACSSPAVQYVQCPGAFGCTTNTGISGNGYSSSGSIAVSCATLSWPVSGGSGLLTKIAGSLADPTNVSVNGVGFSG